MNVPLPQRLDRLERWLRLANDRPLIGFHISSYFPLHAYPNSMRNLPDGIVRPEDIVIEDFLEDAERLFQRHEEAGGDLVWSASPFFGIPWVEAAAGCGVIADHYQGCTRALPPAGFSERPAIPEFSESNPWIAKMLEFIPALARQSAGRYPVGVTLLRGISDLLSALYGGESFVYRMIDAPEEVREVVAKLTAFWIEMGRCLLARLPLFHGGTGGLAYGIWCPGKMIWFQEDAAALLSPTLYERFIYPANCRLASAFEHTIVHLHPSRFVPYGYLVKAGVSAIELTLDCGGPKAEELYPQCKAILESKPLLVWGEVSAGDLEFLLKRLPHRGLAIGLTVDSVKQAGETWETARAMD